MPNHEQHRPGGRAPGTDPATTVVVVTWRGAGHVTECLDGLAAQTRAHRTLVVDNASDDGTAALLAAHPSRPRVLRLPRNAGYAGGLAAALSLVDTRFTAWLNDDAVPEPDWLAVLEDTLDHDDRLAAVGSHLVRADSPVPSAEPTRADSRTRSAEPARAELTSQSAGVRLTADGHGADLTAPGEAFGFCGGAVLLRTAELREAGGVEARFFCYYEDTDTAWRLRLRGHDITVATGALVRHRHGASSAPGSPRFHRWNERNRLLMLLRCAPAHVAARELARFGALTAVLPLRRGPKTPNFTLRVRCLVLAEVVAALPATLRRRATIGRRSTADRADVWRRWAGG